MKKLPAIAVGLLAAAAVGMALSPDAMARTPDATQLAQGYGPGYGMGPGMMGGGMMGQPYANAQPAPINPKRADALLAYIRDNNLSCMQCHSIAGSGFGPPLAAISAGYANRPGAQSVLEDHIAHGFGRMPGGLASGPESARLATLILGLSGTTGSHAVK